jgi:hypothetical protein
MAIQEATVPTIAAVGVSNSIIGCADGQTRSPARTLAGVLIGGYLGQQRP